MDRGRRFRVALVAAAVVIGGALVTFAVSRTATPTGEVTGVVVAIESGTGLGNVRGFTLRVPGGELLTFSLRALHDPTEFPPGHLAEHQATAAPVRVMYRMEGSERLAIHLEDAPR